MRHTARRHEKVKPAADEGGQTNTICLFTTAVDEPKKHTTSAVNRKAATAAGAKTATPAISNSIFPRRAGKMPTAPSVGATGEDRSETGAERAPIGDALRVKVL
jgi:hypothetical protein